MLDSNVKQLAIIGGGAKAAAIAAKAYVLKERGIANIAVTIFEQERIGANWTGKSGYTDGKQRLCTPVERDVGFPYSTTFGGAVDEDLYGRFSWSRYLMTISHGFSNWVDRGRQPPMHEDFADYLKWVVNQSWATKRIEHIEGLQVDDNRWTVQKRGSNGKLQPASKETYDGVVITGPGPARQQAIVGPGTSSCIFDGHDFWLRLQTASQELRKIKKDGQIVVAGAGGTAAAVLAWLSRNGFSDHEIVIVSNQAALYSRGDSIIENRLFNDEVAWQALTAETRKEFFERLNRSVVWATVMEQIAVMSRLQFMDGRVQQIAVDTSGYLTVDIKRRDNRASLLKPAFVINAAGFEEWWFFDLLHQLKADEKTEKRKAKLRDGMHSDFTFPPAIWKKRPPLHVPSLSSAVGPGYGSLLALGGMSDRILRRYVTSLT